MIDIFPKGMAEAQAHWEWERVQSTEEPEDEERLEKCPCCGGEVESVIGMIFCVESETCEWMVEK